MSDQVPPSNDLTDELRRLGENINQFAKNVWENPERQKMQQDLKDGLMDIGNSLEQTVDDFGKSPAGQQIQDEINDFEKRLSSGEVEARVKNSVTSLLSIINQQIEQASERKQSDPASMPPDKER